MLSHCTQTVNTAQELRRPVYRASVARAVNSDQLVSSMQNIKWDIRELMSQHSPYVDVILQVCRCVFLMLCDCFHLSWLVVFTQCVCVCVMCMQELSTFHTQLSLVSKHMPIPKVVNDILWEHCIRTVNRCLVEG